MKRPLFSLITRLFLSITLAMMLGACAAPGDAGANMPSQSISNGGGGGGGY